MIIGEHYLVHYNNLSKKIDNYIMKNLFIYCNENVKLYDIHMASTANNIALGQNMNNGYNVPQLTGNINPNMYVDMVMGGLIVSKFSDIFNKGFELSLKNIVMILLFMLSFEIKDGIKAFVPYIIKQIKESPKLMCYLYEKLIPYCKRYNNKSLCIAVASSNDNNYFFKRDIELSFDESFLIALYNFINKSNKCKFNKKINKVLIPNRKDQIFDEVYFDVEILLDDIENIHIMLNCELKYKINILTDEIKAQMEVNVIENKKDKPKLDDILKDTTNKHTSYIYYTVYYKCPFITYFNESAEIYKKSHYGASSNASWIYKLSHHLYYRYKCSASCHIGMIAWGIFPLLTYVYKPIDELYNYMFDEKNVCIIDPYGIPFTDEEMVSIRALQYKECNFIKDLRNGEHINELVVKGLNTPEKKKEIYQQILELINRNKNENTISKPLSMTLSSKTYFDEAEISKKVLQSISKFQRTESNKIKIFSLSIENEVLTTQKPNPEYEMWLERKNIIEKLTTNINANTSANPSANTSANISANTIMSQLDISFFLNQPIPQKDITIETITKKVKTVNLNELSKNIDALYLKKEDKRKLMTCLSQFKNNKEILEEFSISDKYNILFVGPPGVGKSTSILASASYLQKDLYYLSLNTVKNNEDLMMLFSHVNKNVPNGGIIVMEDIDAMTDIVLQRTEVIDINDNNIILQKIKTNEKNITTLLTNNDDKLTLEYLLNVLQGTLTLSDMIVFVTTNHEGKLDDAFTRPGRFDLILRLDKCNYYQIECIYKTMIKRDIDKNVLKRIKEYTYSPAEIIYHLRNYIFDPHSFSDIDIMKDFITNDKTNEQVIIEIM